MDTTGKTGKIVKAEHKGFTTIFLAGIMGLFLILFFIVGIDFARIYYVKGELQNAADAAALAGVSKITDPADIIQSQARNEAILFASRNLAAGQQVTAVTDGSNALSDSNDITVGNWDSTQTPAYRPGITPINAIEVRPQRKGGLEASRGPVSLLFGQMAGWPVMDVNRKAIASFVPPAIGPFPICFPSCNYETPLITQWGYDDTQDPNDPNVFPRQCTDPELPAGSGGSSPSETLHNPPGQLFFLNSSTQGVIYPKPGLAWTNFVTRECGVNPSCDMPTKDEILPYIMGKEAPQVCQKNICTSNGTIHPVLPDLQVALDKKKKVHTVGGQQITGWRVVVPIVSNLSCGTPGQSCPGAQAGQANPYLVTNFAEVIVTEVVTTGKQGIRMVGLSNPHQVTWTFQCKEGQLKTKTITRWVSSLACQDCSLPLPEQEGNKTRLVQ